MDPLTLGLIFGGGSLLKHFAVDKPRENKERELQAETTRYSPWTGMTGTAPTVHNIAGDVLQGGTAGAMLGASLQAADQAKQLQAAQTNFLKNQAPYLPSGMGSGARLNAAMGTGSGTGPSGYAGMDANPYRVWDGMNRNFNNAING